MTSDQHAESVAVVCGACGAVWCYGVPDIQQVQWPCTCGGWDWRPALIDGSGCAEFYAPDRPEDGA